MDETLGPGGGRTDPPGGPADVRTPPPWIGSVIGSASIRLTRSLIVAALSVYLIVGLMRDLSGFLTIIFLALFLSFAVEPAVNWFAAHGWRRGAATGLIFVVAFAIFVVLFALIVPAVISGFKQLIQTAPAMLDRLQVWLAKLGIDFSSAKVLDEIKRNSDKIIASAANLTGGILGLGASIIGQIFKWATISLFLFYFVAEGPRFRRAICRRLPPARQEQVLFIWEQAIEKTGGYFYSRLLLAAINGTGMYITLRVLKVPFAAPLALFEGLVSEFIPIVGTYIAGAIPVLVGLLFDPPSAIGVVAYLVIYQSVENYFLGPRLTARTMALHPAVAFAAALIGGSLGGVLFAFLALPAAAVIQAAMAEYGRGYEVVESELTKDPPARPQTPKRPIREWMRRRGGPATPKDGS
jgi:predicted PurR-regulated permease PerM